MTALAKLAQLLQSWLSTFEASVKSGLNDPNEWPPSWFHSQSQTYRSGIPLVFHKSPLFLLFNSNELQRDLHKLSCLSLNSKASKIFFFIKAYLHSENKNKYMTNLYNSGNDSSNKTRRSGKTILHNSYNYKKKQQLYPLRKDLTV